MQGSFYQQWQLGFLAASAMSKFQTYDEAHDMPLRYFMPGTPVEETNIQSWMREELEHNDQVGEIGLAVPHLPDIIRMFQIGAEKGLTGYSYTSFFARSRRPEAFIGTDVLTYRCPYHTGRDALEMNRIRWSPPNMVNNSCIDDRVIRTLRLEE